LHNSQWVEYIASQINISRHTASEVKIGVITKVQQDNALIGRIGTFATITYTHEMEDNDDTDSNQRESIVATALSTGRIRVLSKVGIVAQRHYGCNFYNVEPLSDVNLQLPRFQRHDWAFPSDEEVNVYRYKHKQIQKHLSQITPIPQFVYQMVWPWKLVQDVIQEIQANASLNKSVGQNLPSCCGVTETKEFNAALVNPVQFSFWMSGNLLILSDAERLRLLEMHCVIQRLQFLKQKISSTEQKCIKCKYCHLEIATVGDLFTVGGAEGTTGAYVNEGGIIHQTITIRTVTDGVVCHGHPETRDSWFPGYSWTICYCQMCHAHLGWKFISVVKQQEQDQQNRPRTFWGMSNANVTTGSSSSTTI